MELKHWRLDLKFARPWTIANKLGPGGNGGMTKSPVVVVKLRDESGITGLGESAPSTRYQENVETTQSFLERLDPARLSFNDVEGSMRYVQSVAPGNFSPKGALNIALLDGAARRAGQPIYDYLGLGFSEGKHVTSFSLGIDRPEVVRAKALEADRYPILKLKVGSPNDRENFRALREVAAEKWVRVDANEAWKTKELALENLEWLASDGRVQFVEQPMPAQTSAKDWAWLKARSPLPIMADESYRSAQDIERCAGCFHAVNVKLMKTGGITGAFQALQAARQAGLQTMIGCMIETSVLITAAAHLAELADYLDIDGNLLVTNDPFAGATAERGVISFANAPDPSGLRVSERAASAA